MACDQTSPSHCKYHEDGEFICHEVADPSGFCYWHNPDIIKNNPEDKHNLEQFARNGGMLRGIQLKNAKLIGIDLVKHHQKTGFDLSHAELYRADLTGAHMFNITLSHASLMKADLRDANLHCANLTDCNLLGVKWAGAKIQNMQIGETIPQELEARSAHKSGDVALAHDYCEQAEEIYRDLRKAAEREGLFAIAGDFIRKELTMRRYQMPRYSFKRLVSKIIDLFCGYGEAPLRVVVFSMCLIMICAILYFFTGLSYAGKVHIFSIQNDIITNAQFFFNCVYYSVVTFTTLGYGDFAPVGISRLIAAIEAFTGSFTIALFVVVFVKKMTR